MTSRSLLLLACVLAAPVRPASAQSIGYTWTLPAQGPRSGYAGDVDQDGHGDVLVVTRGDSLGVIGHVTVHSVAPEADLYTVYGARPTDGFGHDVTTLGDVDHDGSDDFAVSAYIAVGSFPGYVRVYSGGTAALLWQRDAPSLALYCGYSLARIGDLDQDGADDLVIGSIGATTWTLGSVVAVSGATGATIRDFGSTPGITSGFGGRVGRARDLDQDGFEDVLAFDGGAAASNRLRVLSSATGTVLRAFADTILNASFAGDFVALDDADGDGVPDYVIASETESYPNQYGYGRVRIYSGASGAVLRTFEGDWNSAHFGESVERLPDLDGDGREDVLIGAGSYRHGCCGVGVAEVRYVSSASGATLAIAPGQSTRSILTIDDENGDGVDDYLLPYAQAQAGLRGAIAITGHAFPSRVVGCAPKTTSNGCTPWLEFAGSSSLTLGEDLAVRATGLVPNTSGMFVWSTAGASIPFAGGTLCLASPIHRLQRLVSTVAEGTCGGPIHKMTDTLTKLELAALGPPAGSTIYVQGWFRDVGFVAPNDVGLTDSYAVVLWP